MALTCRWRSRPQHQNRICRLRCVLSVSCQKRAFSSLSRLGCPARGAVRRLRTVGGIGVVLGYSLDEPAGGERVQVCLHRLTNIVRIDLRSSALASTAATTAVA